MVGRDRSSRPPPPPNAINFSFILIIKVQSIFERAHAAPLPPTSPCSFDLSHLSRCSKSCSFCPPWARRSASVSATILGHRLQCAPARFLRYLRVVVGWRHPKSDVAPPGPPPARRHLLKFPKISPDSITAHPCPPSPTRRCLRHPGRSGAPRGPHQAQGPQGPLILFLQPQDLLLLPQRRPSDGIRHRFTAAPPGSVPD